MSDRYNCNKCGVNTMPEEEGLPCAYCEDTLCGACCVEEMPNG